MTFQSTKSILIIYIITYRYLKKKILIKNFFIYNIFCYIFKDTNIIYYIFKTKKVYLILIKIFNILTKNLILLFDFLYNLLYFLIGSIVHMNPYGRLEIEW